MKKAKSLLETAGGKSDAELFGLRCRVYAKNSAPSSWDIVIVGAGGEFFFREGGTETDGNSNLNIQSGQSQQFAESDPAKCVRKLKGLLRYRRNSTGDEGVLEGESDETPSGECAAEWTMEIAPALTVAEDAKNCGPTLRLLISKFA